jgi:hypothetical protein
MEPASTFVSRCPALLARYLRQKLSSLSHGPSAGVVPHGLIGGHRTSSGFADQRPGGCKIPPGCAVGRACLAEHPTCQPRQPAAYDCAKLNPMDQSTTDLERAFQLARSGRCGSLKDIRLQLRAEGYSTMQITGKALARQLQALIQAARTPT